MVSNKFSRVNAILCSFFLCWSLFGQVTQAQNLGQALALKEIEQDHRINALLTLFEASEKEINGIESAVNSNHRDLQNALKLIEDLSKRIYVLENQLQTKSEQPENWTEVKYEDLPPNIRAKVKKY